MNNIKAKLISDPELAAQRLDHSECNVIYIYFSTGWQGNLEISKDLADGRLVGKWKFRDVGYGKILYFLKNPV